MVDCEGVPGHHRLPDPERLGIHGGPGTEILRVKTEGSRETLGPNGRTPTFQYTHFPSLYQCICQLAVPALDSWPKVEPVAPERSGPGVSPQQVPRFQYVDYPSLYHCIQRLTVPPLESRRAGGAGQAVSESPRRDVGVPNHRTPPPPTTLDAPDITEPGVPSSPRPGLDTAGGLRAAAPPALHRPRVPGQEQTRVSQGAWGRPSKAQNLCAESGAATRRGPNGGSFRRKGFVGPSGGRPLPPTPCLARRSLHRKTVHPCPCCAPHRGTWQAHPGPAHPYKSGPDLSRAHSQGHQASGPLPAPPAWASLC
ncbi:uncharacterized protein LOC136768405 [Amia ocellicauda]|uniref:uncharacterized protein LOC136768405 n=1 Tax=Amia ocellicauda TaxID=2972642 RepID=UPI0034649D33